MHTTPSLLLTLEEIGQLVSGSGNPSETLTNIVNLIQQRFVTDVCSVYLLEPDRTTLVLAATIGLRPESVGRVQMRVNEGLAGLVAEQLRPVFVRDATQHPRFKYFREAGEDPYRTFVGVPIIDRGVLQGVLVVQTTESRAFGDDDVRMLSTAGAQLAPIVERGARGRQLRRPGAPAPAGAGAEPVVELGRRGGQPVPRARPGALARVRPQSRFSCCSRCRSRSSRRGRRSSRCTAASTTPIAGCRSTCSRSTPGARANASVLGARPVAYFSAEFGLHESLPIYSGGLGILAGDHLKSASDLGIPLVGVGLYYDQGYFRQRLDIEGWQHEDYLDVDSAAAADRSRQRRATASPLTVEIETRTGRILARVWRVSVGRNTLLLLDSNVDGNSPEDRELTVAPLRRRRARAHPPGTAARRRRRAGAGGARHLARRRAPERRAQRLRRARADPAAHGERGHRRRRGLAPRRRTRRLHDAHAGAGRPRPVRAGADRGASRARCATRSGCRTTT